MLGFREPEEFWCGMTRSVNGVHPMVVRGNTSRVPILPEGIIMA